MLTIVIINTVVFVIDNKTIAKQLTAITDRRDCHIMITVCDYRIQLIILDFM